MLLCIGFFFLCKTKRVSKVYWSENERCRVCTLFTFQKVRKQTSDTANLVNGEQVSIAFERDHMHILLVTADI